MKMRKNALKKSIANGNAAGGLRGTGGIVDVPEMVHMVAKKKGGRARGEFFRRGALKRQKDCPKGEGWQGRRRNTSCRLRKKRSY